MASWSSETDRQAGSTKKQKRRRRTLPFSYSVMITQAILSSKNQQMTLRDIYLWISTRYPNLYSDSETGWQACNTIRHNLSLNRTFKKVPRQDSSLPGKGGYWTIDFQHFDFETFRQKSCIESSSVGDRYSTSAYTTRPPIQRALLGEIRSSASSYSSNISCSTSSVASSPPSSMKDYYSSPSQTNDRQIGASDNDMEYDFDSRSSAMRIQSLLN
ncbi:fork head domain-containing protein [Umbelopsis sp. PMI_123]|nr:fork head domain-containing protein [Umbelopsis sp. PMI_123]